MKIRFIAPRYGAIKATIQKNGRLGFSSAAAKQLNLSKDSYIRLGVNEEDDGDENLYMEVGTLDDNDAFKVFKAGTYYYLNTKNIFNDLGIDYTSSRIIYDIGKVTYEDKMVFKLIKRGARDRK